MALQVFQSEDRRLLKSSGPVRDGAWTPGPPIEETSLQNFTPLSLNQRLEACFVFLILYSRGVIVIATVIVIVIVIVW